MDDEVSADLRAVASRWGSPSANVAKAKSNRRQVERATNKASEFWTGRSSQISIRCTAEIAEAFRAKAAERGMSVAELFEHMVQGDRP